MTNRLHVPIYVRVYAPIYSVYTDVYTSVVLERVKWFSCLLLF